ncbi:ABC transporter permease [Terracidiphilus sp.]|uniref:ABC transporter permease n=1 Tax=Terracidiphilus sp. TaxID=1964191 RepID=UPI003C28BA23
MNSIVNPVFRAMDLSLLHSASLLVPAVRREEWLREWRAEFWHVTDARIESSAFCWQAQREVAAFCLGSFADAQCMRRLAHDEQRKTVSMHSSATQCLLWLALLFVLCATLACLFPGVRAEYDTVLHPVRPNLIVIAATDLNDKQVPAVSYTEFQNWRSSYQRYFDGLGFYRTDTQTVALSATRSGKFTVALASTNMMALLGLPVRAANEAADTNRSLPQVVLSYEMWTRSFGSDPHVSGRTIQVGEQIARIAGVLPCSSWKPPTNPDLWILVPGAQLATANQDTSGFVVAHLTKLGQDAMDTERISIMVRGEVEPWFCGIAINGNAAGPWRIYLFALFLAALALPAVTSLSMSESSFSSHRPSWKQNMARWLFLGAKLALVACIAYFASLDIAYWRIGGYSEIAELTQLAANFLLCLFGFRWALMDQRQRCPVCLRRVTHPARVGLASQTFLGWNGTEMICVGGHTLLHVPSLPTSWFGAQRWLYLDTSWEFLFADLTL